MVLEQFGWVITSFEIYSTEVSMLTFKFQTEQFKHICLLTLLIYLPIFYHNIILRESVGKLLLRARQDFELKELKANTITEGENEN